MADGTPFKDRLRAWRDAVGMSQVQLDESIGKKRGYTAQLESGRMKPPARAVTNAMAEALGLDADFVWQAAALERLAAFDEDLAAWYRAQVGPVVDLSDYDRAVLSTLHKPEFELLYSNLAFEDSAASLAATGLLDATDRDLILVARQLTNEHREWLLDLARAVDAGGSAGTLPAMTALIRKLRAHDAATLDTRPRHYNPASFDLLVVVTALAELDGPDLARLLRAFRETTWAVRDARGDRGSDE